MRSRPSDAPGFTLIELSIVLAILAVLAAAAAPYAATRVRNQTGEKTAREALAIADAAKSYYVANSAWPASIAALQTAGFLPGGWNATNPFGNPYTISGTTTLAVTTTVPADVAPVVARLLPLGTETAGAGGTSVSGTWPRPGQSSDLASAGLPTGAVVLYKGTNCASAGLTEFVSARGRVIVGLQPGGTLLGTTGSALGNLENRTHSHTYSDVIAHGHSVNDPGHHHHLFLGNLSSATPADDTGYGFLYPGTPYEGHPGSWRRSTTTEPAGITVNATGVAMGTTQAASATMPYVQLAVCEK